MSVALESAVLSVLSRPEVSRIAFTLGGMRLDSSSFELVRNRIRGGMIAQCLYFYYRNEQVLKQPGVRPTFSDPIQREAWQVAALTRTRKVLNDADIQKLLQAISRHRLYRRTHNLTKHYDG